MSAGLASPAAAPRGAAVSAEAARVHVDGRDRLGECALWCEREQALYWTDIDNQRLFRWRADASATREAGGPALAGEITEWPMPEPLGSFALCDQPGQLLLGLASGVAMFDLATGEVGPLTPVEADEPRTRINDGRCDPQGRFVFGMFNPHGAAVGGYYRAAMAGVGIGRGLAIERLPLPPGIVGNSLNFSPDGGTLYYTDSPTRTIWAMDYHADGRLGERRVFAQLPMDGGEPDGAAVDADGGLWSAIWGDGVVIRFDAQGRETLRLSVPASQPTCPVFGGPALDRLFVTTARRQCEHEPLAGALFELDPHGHRGQVPHRFNTR